MQSQSQPQTPFRGHGSPYDRGRADSWYRRPFYPHYMDKGIEITDLTEEQISEYRQGYYDNEEWGEHKEYE